MSSRDAVLSAAREQFSRKGYDAATVRAIAAEAGVDPSMINHHFGTKEQLFMAALESPVDPKDHIAAVLSGPREGVGERLVMRVLTVWDSPAGAAGVAVLRTAMQHEWSAALVREFILNRAINPLLAGLGVSAEEASWRGNLVASQISGLILTRYLIKLEPIASTPHAVVARALGPTIQRYLTGAVGADHLGG
ncbi:TetR/AcrR family transcriptional regulator [Arthrobacter bambusae]|uniref:TetR/AcrR family transcriptional regulator n=1 Tax=Arthrobacter bambusae TaxID=1338426 RepID=UPI00277D546B|nr:TetR family transcriptional regulator [Arthrobacter bambusae]MDQ0211107.1 AcrR family transcriptional regulator [Arthrobacter bambusae]MDQ0234448.1 AcrR family transcriptional regulator [Arthrobacter bambusae]